MTLTFDLETWSNATAYSLPQGTLKRRESIFRSSYVGQRDGRTDRQTNNYSASAERGPNNYLEIQRLTLFRW